VDATIGLIERVRRTLPTRTNYAVAKALGMQQNQLARVLKGEFGLGIKAQVRMAEILNMPLMDVVALTEEDKAKRPEEKEFWGRRSPRIAASRALAIVALGIAGLIKTGNVHAEGTVYKDSLTLTPYTLCEVLPRCPGIWRAMDRLAASRSGG
jgi:hypothetical protein